MSQLKQNERVVRLSEEDLELFGNVFQSIKASTFDQFLTAIASGRIIIGADMLAHAEAAATKE